MRGGDFHNTTALLQGKERKPAKPSTAPSLPQIPRLRADGCCGTRFLCSGHVRSDDGEVVYKSPSTQLSVFPLLRLLPPAPQGSVRNETTVAAAAAAASSPLNPLLTLLLTNR